MFADKTHRDIGLLIIRIGIGAAFMLHGFPKLSGGPELWVNLGGAISFIGIDFFHTFFGFMAAISEFAGGLFLILGLLMRPACFFLFCTMAVATAMHIGLGDPFMKFSHALEAAVLFLGLILVGPGRLSLDKIFHPSDV